MFCCITNAENRRLSAAAAFLRWMAAERMLQIGGGDSPMAGDALLKGILLGLSVTLNAAFEPPVPQLGPESARNQTSLQGKNALIQPLLRSATDCIVRAVSGDPKFQASMGPAEINVLIVASMESCVEEMRAMIEAHDRLFGEGSGEAFFMGPYLEILPRAVSLQVKRSLP